MLGLGGGNNPGWGGDGWRLRSGKSVLGSRFWDYGFKGTVTRSPPHVVARPEEIQALVTMVRNVKPLSIDASTLKHL